MSKPLSSVQSRGRNDKSDAGNGFTYYTALKSSPKSWTYILREILNILEVAAQPKRVMLAVWNISVTTVHRQFERIEISQCKSSL
jgi:hypothetical protein